MKISLVSLLAIGLVIAVGCGESNTDNGNEEQDTSKDGGDDITPAHPLETIAIAPSETINTVAIVTWPDDLGEIKPEDIEAAYIEYGLGDDLDKTAPVNVTADNMRTVVLGMKAGALTYSIQSTVVVDGETYTSPVHTFETGYAPTGISECTEKYRHASLPIDEGYLLLGAMSGSMVTIIDTDGDPVWWTEKVEGSVSESAGTSEMWMDWKGGYIYLMPTNPSWAETHIRRVSIDGMEIEDFDVGRGHHSLKPVPEGGVIFVQQTEDTCDAVMHLDEGGNITEVLKWTDFMPFTQQCHTNFVGYEASSDSIYLSSRDYDLAALVSRDGELQWAIGRDEYQTAETDDFEMGAPHDIIALHGLYVWNNGQNLLLFNNIGSDPAVIYEYAFDDARDKADTVLKYTREGAHSTQLGNAQRLPSGNTLIVYSVAGIINQIDPEGVVVHRLDFDVPVGYGYWRPTLYGPPPE